MKKKWTLIEITKNKFDLDEYFYYGDYKSVVKALSSLEKKENDFGLKSLTYHDESRMYSIEIETFGKKRRFEFSEDPFLG